jgi:formylglycine-generating enzyme required for sulfatase activity
MSQHLALVVVCAFVALAATDVIIETVTVGNPGNPDDIHYTGFGGVDYTYNIGKYELTAGQYTEFLNAVAVTDTYGLYHPSMSVIDPDPEENGCGIVRSGSPGSYSYSVAADWADRPVNFVNWGDAARFCNWLHNGQPTGTQNLTTTEDGSYYLNGAMSNPELMAITREPDATWVIPTEDEFYKAAFHKNDGVTGNYWNYATGTDDVPSYELIDPDPGNNATFVNVDPYDWTIGAPYWRTELGAHENSVSPYGTFDQGGNLFEWTEGVYGEHRATGYGSFDTRVGALSAAEYDPSCTNCHAADHVYQTGFRVAQVNLKSLSVDINEIPLQGEQVNFSLLTGFENAGRNYLLLGGASGTLPGKVLPGGYVTLPLNWDSVTDLLLTVLNTTICVDFYGQLNGFGEAAPQLNMPALSPGLIGTVLYFASCLNNPFDYVSNPMEVTIVP